MAKKINAVVKLQLPGGGANPGLVGSVLGQHGIKMMDFCQQFNAQTSDKKGEKVPVVMNVYADKTFDFVIKTPLVSELIKKKISLSKGSSNPGTVVAGKISMSDIAEIAQLKMPDLNAMTIEQASKIVAGSARSMGLEIVD